MYGLQLRLLEEYVEKELGKEKLDAMKKKIGAGVQNFIQHKTYSEDFFVKLLGQAAQDLGKPHEECLEVIPTSLDPCIFKKGGIQCLILTLFFIAQEMGHGLWRYLEKTHQNKVRPHAASVIHVSRSRHGTGKHTTFFEGFLGQAVFLRRF
eukprot:3220086-Rhodomonas_salina.1